MVTFKEGDRVTIVRRGEIVGLRAIVKVRTRFVVDSQGIRWGVRGDPYPRETYPTCSLRLTVPEDREIVRRENLIWRLRGMDRTALDRVSTADLTEAARLLGRT